MVAISTRRGRLRVFLTAVVVALCLAGLETTGETQTLPPGIMVQAQNVFPLQIPAGAQTRVNGVSGSVPSNMSGTVMTRVIAYLSSGIAATTCSVAINVGARVSAGSSTSGIPIPANTAIAVSLEQETEALPGKDLTQSILITAGGQGPCTLLPWSSLTVLALPPINEQGYFGY